MRRRCSASDALSGSAFSRKMSTQIRGFAPATRVMSRREPPAARSGSWPLDPRRARLVDEQVRERVREVARQRDEPVVRLRVDRDRGRAELGDEPVDEPVALGIGAGERRQEPGRALEELGARVLRPARLGAADGWPPMKRADPRAAPQITAFVDPTSVTVHASPLASRAVATC